jgi:hypothetical protein
LCQVSQTGAGARLDLCGVEQGNGTAGLAVVLPISQQLLGACLCGAPV